MSNSETPGGVEPVDKVKHITAHSLVKTEIFGPDEEENEEEQQQRQKEFWDRNRQLNKAFAQRTRYCKACKLMRLDLECTQSEGTYVQLKPW
jgi:hypothetical protein